MRAKSFSVIACVLLSSCQQPTTYTPQMTKAEIAAEEENQQRIVDEIRARGGKPKSWKNRPGMRGQFERVGARIEKAGADVCRELGLQKRGCYYYFDMSRSEDLNAAADGKSVVINTGMMRFLESDDELAAIMGHELAHNLMGHIDAQKQNAMAGILLGAAVEAIAASQGVRGNGDIMQAGGQAGVESYSIEFEQEADYVGLYVMARAGYDVRRAPTLWRRMSIENPEAIYNAKTHPSNAARYVALAKGIDEIAYKKKHRLPLLPDFIATKN